MLQLRYKDPRQRALEAAWRMDGMDGHVYLNPAHRQQDINLFKSYFESVMVAGFASQQTKQPQLIR